MDRTARKFCQRYDSRTRHAKHTVTRTRSAKLREPISSVDTPSRPQRLRRWQKFIFLACGGFFFLLGVLGAVLPGLPATPFLLLTSYFLVRSSPRLNAALLKSRFFGPILVDWQEHGGMRADVKLQAIVFVALAVGATIYFANLTLVPALAIVGLAMVGVTVIARLPTARRPSDPSTQVGRPTPQTRSRTAAATSFATSDEDGSEEGVPSRNAASDP